MGNYHDDGSDEHHERKGFSVAIVQNRLVAVEANDNTDGHGEHGNIDESK